MSQLENNKSMFFWWAGLFAFTLLLRVASFYTPILDIDETQFAGFAHVLMDGGLPYLHSLDTKPLGIYWFFQLIFSLFGRTNMVAVHFATTLLYFFGAVLLYRMVFKGFQCQKSAKWASLLFLVFTTTSVPKILSTSINSVMIFWLILSAYFLFLYIQSAEKVPFVLSALFLGVALIFKYNAGIQIFLFPFTLILISPKKLKILVTVKFWMEQIAYGLILCIPFLLHALYLHHLGVLDEFVLWSLKGSGAYISQGSQTISFFRVFAIRVGAFVGISWLCFYGLSLALRKRLQNPLVVFSVIWLVLSFIPVCVGGRFYPHYFLQILPALSVLGGVGLQTVRLKKAHLILGLFLPILVFWTLRFDYPFFLKHFPNMDLYLQKSVAQNLKSDPEFNPKQKMFVWGFATGLYFWSGAKASSRFLWADLLCGRTPGPKYARAKRDLESQYKNPKAWKRFWDDMRANTPTWFVDTSPAKVMQYQYFPISAHPKLAAWLKEHYELHKVDQGVHIYKRIGQ